MITSVGHGAIALGQNATIQASQTCSIGISPPLAQVPLRALGNRCAATQAWASPPPLGRPAQADTWTGVEPRLLELAGVSRARLDDLSRALADKPLSGDALAQLIEGGFHRTVLAKPMAAVLVANAMPQLLDPGDASFAAWEEVLVLALVQPPDQWKAQCMGLRSRLLSGVASGEPLFTGLYDVLQRHTDASARQASDGAARRPSASCPCPPQMTDPTATMLLDVGRDARLAPSVLQSMLNGVRVVVDWMSSTFMIRNPWHGSDTDPGTRQQAAWKRPTTDPSTRKTWPFSFPAIFPGADASELRPIIAGAGVPDEPFTSDISVNQPTIRTDSQAAFADSRGDLRILHEALREHQMLLRQSKQPSAQVCTDQVFLPVGTHSLAAEYTARISEVLTHLKLRLVLGSNLPDFYDSMGIASSGTAELLGQLSTKKLDLKEAFTVALSFGWGAQPCFRFNGTSAKGSPIAVDIKGPRALMLSGYLARIREVQKEAQHRGTRSKGSDEALLRKLIVRDDAKVALQSLARFYGIAVPDAATRADLQTAIDELRPKASLIASAGDQRPPAIATSFSIDTINPPEPIYRASNEHETSDYGAISREIKLACTQAREDRVAQLTQSHGDSAKGLFLSGLKSSGGISLRLKLDDTDGEDDTYVERHSVNPRHASTVEEYFDQCADLLGDYMTKKIRDKDGENEGAINIAWLELHLYVPHFVASELVVTSDDVKVFNMRDATPPFLYVDPGCMSADASQAVSKAMGDITTELPISNGDASKAPTILAAVNRRLGTERTPDRVSEAVDSVLEAYYRISSQGIARQQRLLLAKQPTEEEFLSRVICRQLGIDEFNWPIIMGRQILFNFETGPENRGSFLRGEASVSKTMLELVYDEDLRREIGLATNKDGTCAAVAASIANACLIPCDQQVVQANIGAFFNAFSVLGLISGVSSEPLPTLLIHAGREFSRYNDQYAINATDAYRKLEAERTVLASGSVLRRLGQAVRVAKQSARASRSIDFQGLLTHEERAGLDAAAARFRDFLSVRRNGDAFHDLQPGWEQALAQLRSITLEICRNAPLSTCMAINLISDIDDGADLKTVALDGLFYLSSAMRNIPGQRLGALIHAGSNAWTLEQSVEAYGRAVKDGRYEDANKNLANILMSGHSLLSSGAALVERGRDSISERSLRDTSDAAANEALDPGEPPPVPSGAQITDHYWSADKEGIFSRQSIGREVCSSLWNGDVLVEGGARAISLNNDVSTAYMLGDTPCRAVRAASGALELWPVRDLALAENAWLRAPGAPGVSYSHPALPAFPQTFAGPSGGRTALPHDAVAWFDNHVSIFESIQAEHVDAEGRQIGPSSVHMGILEHKYVLDQDGAAEILEHLGSRNGKTQFVRNDGSTFTVERSLPAWPQYKSEIKATVVGSSGMFVAAEVSGAVDGLDDKRRISGAVAAKKNGGHELVVELDVGVYYRGDLPAGVSLPLNQPASNPGLRAFELGLRRISPSADPKRASPSVWHARGAYRDSEIAHDDFALELLFGSKLANRAYSNNYPWVQAQHELIQSARLVLPPEVRTTEHPYYELATIEADAILFAPRSRAVLANTLIAQTVEWGPLSSPADLDLVEGFLRSVLVNDAGDGVDAPGSRSPLLGANERIPEDANGRDTMHAQLKTRLHNRNLVLADVETTKGKKVQFVNIHATDASEVVVAGSEVHVSSQAGGSARDVIIKPGQKAVHGGSTESVVRHIQSLYPNPLDVRSITIFSLDAISHRLAEDIFTSSASGYKYRSILRLRSEGDAEIPASIDRKSRPDVGIIRPAVVDMSVANLVTGGDQKDAYQWGGHYYVPLGSEGVYRAEWDSGNAGFRLLPEAGKSSPVESLPLARKVNGHFRLINPPLDISSRTTVSTADRRRLKQELEMDPTPQVLHAIRRQGRDIVIVADPETVSEKVKLDGRWVITVNGVEYGRALTETGAPAYVRDHPEEAMEMVCGGRPARAVEPLCVAGAGSYIESKYALKAADLPAEGTDVPDTEDWTTWTSDTRVYGTALSGRGELASWATGMQLVPYEGRYCKLDASREQPKGLTPRERREFGLPASVAYADSVEARLMYRKGHGARVRIENFETHLPGSTLEVGASMFKKKDSHTEWVVTLYDGQWYQGSFDRPSGAATPVTFPMTKMRSEADLSEQEREIQRLHAGLQTANYHAKTTSPEKLKEIMEINRRLGLSPATFDACVYFDSSTTGEQAFLFDRFTREHVQVRVREAARWSWLKLDEVAADPEVARSRNDLVEISRAVFDDQTIRSIDDLLKFSADKKIPIGPRNFLLVRENSGDIYFSISGRPKDKMTPSLFKAGGRAEIEVGGKKVAIVYIDADPSLDTYMAALERSGDYPRALPTAASPDQLSAAPSVFDVTTSRATDTERKMIAYLTQGGVPNRSSADLVEVLNRNDACKSCASLLQQYFKPFAKVIHFYGNDYTKY
jgi:hypothetical protein